MLRWFEKHNYTSWGITLFGAVAIFYISSLTFSQEISMTSTLSIVYHFCSFFYLTLFLQISSLQGKQRYSIFLLTIFLAFLYGILDELHQFFVPGRACTLFDVGIDGLGILFASMIYFIKIEFKKKFKF